jgi:hypothetical protein
MQELLLGTWWPEIIAYSQHYPWRGPAAVLSATSIVLTLMFGRPSLSGGGDDFSGIDIGDGDGGCGD